MNKEKIAKNPIETHKYKGERYLTLDSISKLQPLFDEASKDVQLEELASDLAPILLAEWIAIEHGKTRLQSLEYMEEAQSLADWLFTIGYRLVGKRGTPDLIDVDDIREKG